MLKLVICRHADSRPKNGAIMLHSQNMDDMNPYKNWKIVCVVAVMIGPKICDPCYH